MTASAACSWQPALGDQALPSPERHFELPEENEQQVLELNEMEETCWMYKRNAAR